MASATTNNNSNSPPPNPTTPWPNSEKEYDLIEVIGVGATAAVFSAFCEKKNEKCAIKRINLEKWNTSMDELLKEIQAMSFCNHDNVVTYYTSFVVEDELWLILKLLEGGSLLDVIKHKMRVTNCKHGVFDEATIATVLKEVLRGLEYFHNNGQIHRDIKAGNILLGEDGTVQIADFGVSAWLSTGRDNSRQKVRHTFVGTPCWMAPEVMEQDHGYDFKADIWSFGITAIEMATGTAPYHKFPPMKVLMLTLQNDPPSLDTSSGDRDTYKAYGKTFRKMIVECLQKDPAKRPTAAELLKHSFFKKAKDRKYLTQTLVAIGPSMETRVHKASKRQPGSSGRLHRSNTGEWVWSEEEDEQESDEQERSEGPESRPMNQLQRADSSGSEEEVPAASVEKKVPETEHVDLLAEKKADSPIEKKATLPAEKKADSPAEKKADLLAEKKADLLAEKKADLLAEKKADLLAEKKADLLAEKKADLLAEKKADLLAEKKADLLAEKKNDSPAEMKADSPAEKKADSPAEKKADSPVGDTIEPRKGIVNLVLRVRINRCKLNDIRFEFVFGQDTVDGIASELVAAGLVDPVDAVEIGLNLTKLLDSQAVDPSAPKTVTFHLNSTGPNEPFDDKTLFGFAQLTIVD